MSKTWIQLQWLRNNSDYDHTVKYEVYRSLTPITYPLMDPTGLDKVLEIEQPATGEFVLVSDSPDNHGGNDDLKQKFLDIPYDMAAPDIPTGLLVTADHANNKAIVTWDALVNDNGTPYYYAIRAIDDNGDVSDLSIPEMPNVDHDVMISDLHATPYILEWSSNGVSGWTALPAQTPNTYDQTNVDIAGPDTVSATSYKTSKVSAGIGRIQLDFTHPSKDNGTLSRYYRIRSKDDTANKFPGHPDNISNPSAVAPAVVVLTQVTDGDGGVEIKYKNTKASAPDITLTLDTDDKYIGYTELIPGSPVVKNTSETTTYLEGQDYSFNYSTGHILRIGTGTILAGQAIKIKNVLYNNYTNPGDADSVLASSDVTVSPEVTITFNTDDKATGITQILVGSPIVKSSDGLTTYVENRDYTFDYPVGTIQRVPSGTITSGATIKIANILYNPVARNYDGTLFTGGYTNSITTLHENVAQLDSWNYRIRVKDNVGNWSDPVYIRAVIGDFTAPVPPENFLVTLV